MVRPSGLKARPLGTIRPDRWLRVRRPLRGRRARPPAKRLRHVHQHGAGAKAPLAVAAAVVEAHAGARVLAPPPAVALRSKPFRVGAAGGTTPVSIAHSQPPACVRGDAAHHLRCRPVIDLAAGRLPAIQPARGDVDPVQRLLRRQPDRAFADGVARIENQFGFHGDRSSVHSGLERAGLDEGAALVDARRDRRDPPRAGPRPWRGTARNCPSDGSRDGRPCCCPTICRGSRTCRRRWCGPAREQTGSSAPAP